MERSMDGWRFAPGNLRIGARLLHSKGIPHRLELWGYDVAHDWPWWRKMLPHYVGNVVGW